MRARSEVETLLAELLAAGAIPRMEGERLKVDAPSGVLTPERRQRIAAASPELRAIVASRWRSREECVARRPCRRMAPCAEPIDGRPCTIPAACCLCGANLGPGSKYLCPPCAEAGLTAAQATR